MVEPPNGGFAILAEPRRRSGKLAGAKFA
jgi:hypothetical protein